MLDQLFAEPKRWHPLIGFGNMASLLERKLNRPHQRSLWLLLAGTVALLLSVLPLPLLLLQLNLPTNSSYAIDVLLLYLIIGRTSLAQHTQQVATALLRHDIVTARSNVARIVSRDTQNMTPLQICRATIESILENGNDAVIAPLFWYAVAGIEAALLYRLVNTLDAMWGYRTERYLYFGRAAARLDDLLNWLPARINACGYLLAGSASTAWMCWRNQAKLLASPNGGVVMSSGAGAMQLLLGGQASYHGKTTYKPLFGCGREPEAADIAAATALLDRVVLFFVVAVGAVEVGMFIPIAG